MKTLLASILLAFSLNAYSYGGSGSLIECRKVGSGFNAVWVGTYEYRGNIFQRSFSFECPVSVSL